jgi:hypothetical protein
VDRDLIQSRAVTVGVGVGVALAVGVGIAIGVGITLAVGEGVGFGMATPLFHTSFLPLLTHVYFLPPVDAVAPSFEHLVPGVIAANEICVEKIEIKATATIHTGALRIVTR